MDDTIAAENANPPHDQKLERPKRFIPGRWTWLLVVFCIVAILVLRQSEILNEGAYTNIFTLILGFIALMALVVWFSFRSDYSRRLRIAVPTAMVLAVVVFFALFEIKYCYGDLTPKFGLRNYVAWLIYGEDDAPELIRLADQDELPLKPIFDFPQFLGPNRDAYVEAVQLETDWDAHAPQEIWRRKIGEGWSGFTTQDNRIFTMEQQGEKECITCYNLSTGEEIWNTSVKARHDSPMGHLGPRATPTLADDYVYAHFTNGDILCMRIADGEIVWRSTSSPQ